MMIQVTRRKGSRQPMFREAAATTVSALATLDQFRNVRVTNAPTGVVIYVEGVQSDENGQYTILDHLENPANTECSITQRVYG